MQLKRRPTSAWEGVKADNERQRNPVVVHYKIHAFSLSSDGNAQLAVYDYWEEFGRGVLPNATMLWCVPPWGVLAALLNPSESDEMSAFSG